MSEIQKALAAATEVEPSKRKNETPTDQEYMKRLAVAVGELSDEDWGKLPAEQQDWYNNAADALKLGKPIPEFQDMAPAATSRRRAGAEPAKPYTPKVGDVVNVTTKRGRTYEGVKIVELDDAGLVLDNDTELDHDKIDKIALASGVAEQEPEEPATPEVGDTVHAVTARGKEITGNISEMDGDDLVLIDATGEVHELSIPKLKSITVKVKNAGAAVEQPKPSKAERKEEPATIVTKTKITAKDNGGVSATQRMRELICSDLDMKKEAVSAKLKAEGLEFKQATLDLTYSDSHRLISILRDLKKIK
jgi:hypothetical protein